MLETYVFLIGLLVVGSVVNVTISGWLALKMADFIYEKIRDL